MIMAEVFAPALGQTYDFELDETAKIDLIIEELLEMLCRKEHRTISASHKRFCLGDIDAGIMLDPNAMLSDYAIKSGARLILT